MTSTPRDGVAGKSTGARHASRRAARSPGVAAPPGTQAVPGRPLLATTPVQASRGPNSSRDVLAATMTEAQLEEHVRALCRGLGILRFHVRHAKGMTHGFPDDVLVGSRGVLWRELKTQRGKATPAQEKVGEALLALGQDWDLWRPEDLLSNRIARELASISGIAAGGRGNHPAGTRRPPQTPGDAA